MTVVRKKVHAASGDRRQKPLHIRPQLPREILERIGALADLAPIAAAHHERIDGMGYPLGLFDHDIKLETRIITACDIYDALTADRPCRAAMTVDEALAVTRAEVGTAIDPECFAALTQFAA
jgi:HD-GYP domain-containing protein (c-di-GMP phosphodiesterase class II)